MLFSMRIIGIVLLARGLSWADDLPEWVKGESQNRKGSIYSIICNGVGPDLEVARKLALASCRYSAVHQLQSSAKVKGVSVQTEKDAAYHEEIAEEVRYDGLICKPLNESIKEEPNQVKVFLKCQFDLRKASATDVSDSLQHNAPYETRPIANGANLESLESRDMPKIHRRSLASTSKRVLTVTSVPACRDLIIRGDFPRIETCKSNPMPAIIENGDSEVIVRAPGYLPKTIKLNETGVNDDEVRVFLEK